jgi:hypothetical protein
MSHHFDYPEDERLDISDAYCFPGASDARGPRTVFGMNASPGIGKPWDPAGYYELKLDTNDDYVEDITWRFTFPVNSAGQQYVQVAELTGKEATSRTAKGKIITPPNAPVGEVLHLDRGIKIFAGKRRDPFFNYIPFPEAVTSSMANGVLVEAPVAVTGLCQLNYWATTAIYDQGHSIWRQLQRAAGPNVTTFWGFVHGSAQTNINATVPSDDLAGRPANPATDPASGVWGQLRDQTAAVVAAGGTFDQGIHGQPTALAYGAYVADTLLPNVLRFFPGTYALWDPGQGIQNGKGLVEDAFDNVTKLVLNQDFRSGLTQPSPLLDYFPYVSPPPAD